MSSWLVLDDAYFGFRAKALFRGLTLKVSTGPLIWLEGPSGSGKSTLLRIFAGHYPLKSGECRILGETVKSPSPQWSYCFQDYKIFPWLTVHENIALGLKIASWTPKKIDERVAHLLEAAKLSETAELWPHQLSGGMKQRVAILRALAPKPTCLLLDEPFSSLDQANTSRMLNLCKVEIQQTGGKCIIASHESSLLISKTEPRLVCSIENQRTSVNLTELS